MAESSNIENPSERKCLEMIVVPTIDDLPNPSREEQHGQDGAFLYVIEFDDAVKIGVSQNPYRRAVNLRAGSGRYSNRAAYSGPFLYATRAERGLLNMFAIQRIADSEWVNMAFEDVLDQARLIDVSTPTEEDLLRYSSRSEISKRLLDEFFNEEKTRNCRGDTLREQLRLILPMFYILVQDVTAKIVIEQMKARAEKDGLVGILMCGVRECSPDEWVTRAMKVLKSGELEYFAEDLAKFYFIAATNARSEGDV